MNSFPIVARAATLVNADAGLSLGILAAWLGAAGAVVAVARWYIGFLRKKADREQGIIDDFKGSHSVLQQNFQEQLDRLSDRHQDTQREFQAYVAVISDIQNMILRDVIVTMKNIEKTNAGSAVMIRGIQKTISTIAQPDQSTARDPRGSPDGET